MRKLRFPLTAILLLLATVFPPAVFSQQAKEAAAQTFPVTVDYNRSIEEMVAAGKYDWSSSDINTENFPVTQGGKAKVNIELVHFEWPVDSNQVFAELEKLGLRPATLPELLEFGTKYPDMQIKFHVVALGSVWRRSDGQCIVVSLWSDTGDRGLRLLSLEDVWYGDYRFAAVRKEK